MKKLIFIFSLVFFLRSIYGQETPSEFLSSCMHEGSSPLESTYSISEFSLSEIDNCGNTSPYWNDNSLYIPTGQEDAIYIKVNLIFLTKPDGTGNFEADNPEHTQAIDDLIARCNQRFRHSFDHPNDGNQNTTIQVIANKIWKVDEGWDYEVTDFDLSRKWSEGGSSYYVNSQIYPPNPNYYYRYLDDDPEIPSDGINLVFVNNGTIYEDMVVQQNHANYEDRERTESTYASEFPSRYDLTKKNHQMYPDVFLKYYWMKNIIPNTLYPYPWSVIRNWFVSSVGGQISHEMGHSFHLYHQRSGTSNPTKGILNGVGLSSHTDPRQNIGSILKAASTTSIRQYFTHDSYHNVELNIAEDELWDVDFRIYKDVVIEDSTALTVSCNLIVPPENKIIIRDGGTLTLNQGTLHSANNTAWEGIKIEGNGFLEILPGTDITPPFSAVTGYTYVPKSSTISRALELNDKNLDTYSTVPITLFPNPFDKLLSVQIPPSQANSILVIKDHFNKPVLEAVLTEKSTQLDVSHLQNETYYLSLWKNGIEIYSQPLLKK